ncbi:elongation factor G, partial [bacterium]|nr:elongation factor G [bacterium]
DYNADEIERKISISASFLHCNWKNCKINMLDTPGYPDFTGEVKGGLYVVDLGVVFINALSGVEVGTEIVWGYAEEYNIPRIIVINKLDKENVNFDKILEVTKNRFGSKVVLVQIPVEEGMKFNSVIDLLKMKLLKFKGDSSGACEESDIPADLKQKAEGLREKLVESVAESDDELIERYLENDELSEEEFAEGFKKAVLNREIFPVFCCAASLNVSTKSVLDFIVDYCPSPVDFSENKGINPDSGEEIVRKNDDGETGSIFVFKTVSELNVGEISLFKVMSGVIKHGMEMYNPNKNESERIGQIYLMNGKDRKEINEIHSGDIGAVVKLKNTHTGNTLCARKSPIKYKEIDTPKPVIRIAIEPKSKGDEEKISTGLSLIHEEDPSFHSKYDPELRQTIVSGQGELHLDIIVKRLKQKFGVEVGITEPRIPYRETIKGKSEMQGKYKKQSGGRGQYGDVWLKLEPQKRGEGFEFVNAIVGGAIPSKYIPSVEKGVLQMMDEGVIAGYKAVDVKATVYDGSYHSVDSSDIAFKVAATMAFKKCFKDAKPILLEPIYDIEVTVPEEFMGDAMGDISGRRGKIGGMEAQGPFQIIKAKVPLSELYKYSTTLRSITSGRGIHRQKLSHYEEVPKDITAKIIEQTEKEKQEE